METNLNAVHIQDGEDMNLFNTPSINGDGKQICNLEDFDQIRITKEKDIPQPEPTIKIGGGAFASPGNISAISAAAKAGKTAFTGAIIAGAIALDGIVDGFTDVEVLPNSNGKGVVCFDTEQSKADQQYSINVALKRAHIERTPDYYRSYNLRQLNFADYKNVTDNICEQCSIKFNGIHIIIIDGGADYLLSVNDEEQSTLILQYFTHLAIKYNCPVIIVVHLNPGTEKERGHFGSILQRKCYGLITIKKDGDISTAEPKLMRKAGNGEIPLIHFAYNKEMGYHVQIDAPNKTDDKSIKTLNRMEEIAMKVFAMPNALTHTQSIEAIMKNATIRETTAKTYLKNMTVWDLVDKGQDGRYRLKQPIRSGSI